MLFSQILISFSNITNNMNQPIPRSFFKDGQRAKYEEREGRITIRTEGSWKDFIIFVPNETTDSGDFFVLCSQRTIACNDRHTELLDRTIDQVMEGDKISNGMSMRQVIGRVGDAVALYQIDGKVDWVQVSRLVDDKYEIVQPSTPEVMTEEKARELVGESRKNAWHPKLGEKFYYWEVATDEVDGFTRTNHSIDIALWSTGNCFPYTEEGKKQCEEWGKKYAPAFIYLMNR